MMRPKAWQVLCPAGGNGGGGGGSLLKDECFPGGTGAMGIQRGYSRDTAEPEF